MIDLTAHNRCAVRLERAISRLSTINKDTRALVAKAIEMVDALQTGEEPEVNDTESYDNGKKVVPAYLLDPVIVTKENAAEAYANDPNGERDRREARRCGRWALLARSSSSRPRSSVLRKIEDFGVL